MGWPVQGAAWPTAAPPPPALSNERQLDALKGQAEYLEDALKSIRMRIEEIEMETKSG